MLQPRLYRAAVSAEVSLSSLATTLNSLSLCSKHAHLQQSASTTFVRHASHAAQGRANGPKDSAGRRLGAKKSDSEYVIPGNIIFKQRGTLWHPGENVGMGKDHTIYATVAGYVRYYKNPMAHPKRRYIGVALERDGPESKLPTPPNVPTRRRLGMYATPIKDNSKDVSFLESHLSENSVAPSLATAPQEDGVSSSETSPPPVMIPKQPTQAAAAPTLRRGTYREANFEIGRAAEKKGVSIKEYDRHDRWLAWRKRAEKVKQKMLAKAMRASRKTKGKKSNVVKRTAR